MQEAESDDLMAQQADKLTHGAVVSKMLRAKAAAKILVAKELRSIEEVSLGGAH